MIPFFFKEIEDHSSLAISLTLLCCDSSGISYGAQLYTFTSTLSF